MALIRLVSPDSDSEILTIVAMLEAHGIPSYVRGGGFGGLFPGVQINAYNTRDIMIPEEQAADALALLRDFQSQAFPPEDPRKYNERGWLRNVLELLAFGWFMPGSRATRQVQPDVTPDKRRSGP